MAAGKRRPFPPRRRAYRHIMQFSAIGISNSAPGALPVCGKTVAGRGMESHVEEAWDADGWMHARLKRRLRRARGIMRRWREIAAGR